MLSDSDSDCYVACIQESGVGATGGGVRSVKNLSAFGHCQCRFEALYRFRVHNRVIKVVPGYYCPWKEGLGILFGVVVRYSVAAVVIPDVVVDWVVGDIVLVGDAWADPTAICLGS